MTILGLYEATIAELAEVDAYRLRLLGRADTLRELCAAGLAETMIAESGDCSDEQAGVTPRGALSGRDEVQGA